MMETMRYVIANGAPVPHDKAEQYASRINYLIKRNQSNGITPREIVDDARAKNSPLHDYFEWDDKKAAMGYRDQQARRLINSILVIRVEDDGTEVATKAFVSVTQLYMEGDEEKKERVYITINRALTEDDKRAQIIQYALKEVEYWKDRYIQYQELQPIFDAIDSFKY